MWLWIFLISLAILFPNDAQIAAETVIAWVKVEVMNVRLYLMQRRMHAQLSRDFKERGLPPIPFVFVPLQKRGKR